MAKRKGWYIVFEGIVGSGKTTQSKLLYQWLKDKYPKKTVIWTREPGGSEVAESIRKVVQGTDFKELMDPVCEQYLYAASRAQTLRTVVRPVLESGGIVVADRSVFTSFTNQGFGRGMGLAKVLEINRAAVEDLWPDKVIYLSVPVKTGLSRTRDGGGDKFEKYGDDFYRKVVRGYRYVRKAYKQVEEVDGRGEIGEVQRRIRQVLGLEKGWRF